MKKIANFLRKSGKLKLKDVLNKIKDSELDDYILNPHAPVVHWTRGLVELQKHREYANDHKWKRLNSKDGTIYLAKIKKNYEARDVEDFLYADWSKIDPHGITYLSKDKIKLLMPTILKNFKYLKENTISKLIVQGFMEVIQSSKFDFKHFREIKDEKIARAFIIKWLPFAIREQNIKGIDELLWYVRFNKISSSLSNFIIKKLEKENNIIKKLKRKLSEEEMKKLFPNFETNEKDEEKEKKMKKEIENLTKNYTKWVPKTFWGGPRGNGPWYTKEDWGIEGKGSIFDYNATDNLRENSKILQVELEKKLSNFKLDRRELQEISDDLTKKFLGSEEYTPPKEAGFPKPFSIRR